MSKSIISLLSQFMQFLCLAKNIWNGGCSVAERYKTIYTGWGCCGFKSHHFPNLLSIKENSEKNKNYNPKEEKITNRSNKILIGEEKRMENMWVQILHVHLAVLYYCVWPMTIKRTLTWTIEQWNMVGARI